MNKLIVILGPTSSGKSSLAIKLAKKFKGEIISADSRQVYQGMNIGTGKVTRVEQKMVPHHLLDIANPKKQFSVAEFKPYANLAISKITSKDKVPFLVGGTPFWIYAVIDDLQIPEVAPNLKLRKQLEKKSTSELFAMLKKLDPRRAKNIDAKNPRRLIRAIEIVKTTGKPVPVSERVLRKESLLIGLKKNQTQKTTKTKHNGLKPAPEIKGITKKKKAKKIKKKYLEKKNRRISGGFIWKTFFRIF